MEVRSQLTRRYRNTIVEDIRAKVARRTSLSQKDNRQKEYTKSRGLALADVNVSTIKEEVANKSGYAGNENKPAKKQILQEERRAKLQKYKEEKQKKLKEQREKANKGVFKCGVYRPESSFLPVLITQNSAKGKKDKPPVHSVTRVTRSTVRVEPLANKTHTQTIPVNVQSSKAAIDRAIPKDRGPAPVLKKNEKENKASIPTTRITRSAANASSKVPTADKTLKNAQAKKPQEKTIKETGPEIGLDKSEPPRVDDSTEKVKEPEPIEDSCEESVQVPETLSIRHERLQSFAPENFVFQPLDGLSAFTFQPMTPNRANTFLTPTFTWSPQDDRGNFVFTREYTEVATPVFPPTPVSAAPEPVSAAPTPVSPPTLPPVSTPEPVSAPAPVSPPTLPPVSTPEPVSPPTLPPVSAPEPVSAPAPVSPPTLPPVSAPAPVSPPTLPPVSAPEPVSAPAPVSPPTLPPVSAPEPVSAPAPVSPPTLPPVSAPTEVKQDENLNASPQDKVVECTSGDSSAPQTSSARTPPPCEPSSEETSMPAQEPLHDVPYFRDLLRSEIQNLTLLCNDWDKRIDMDIPEDAKDLIRTTVGQTRLLMTERFKQFEGLVNNCEFKTGEKETMCTDLDGFWDMIYFQIKDVSKKFSNLEQLEQNSWQQNVVQPKKAARKKTAPGATGNPNKGDVGRAAAKSRLAAIKAAMKNKVKTEDPVSEMEAAVIPMQVDPIVFDAGFFRIESPAKLPSGLRANQGGSQSTSTQTMAQNSGTPITNCIKAAEATMPEKSPSPAKSPIRKALFGVAEEGLQNQEPDPTLQNRETTEADCVPEVVDLTRYLVPTHTVSLGAVDSPGLECMSIETSQTTQDGCNPETSIEISVTSDDVFMCSPEKDVHAPQTPSLLETSEPGPDEDVKTSSAPLDFLGSCTPIMVQSSPMMGTFPGLTDLMTFSPMEH
ncbi:disks large-associated protein 5 isoform 1-T7 [Anomaloglossus baeobatrachus]|uniref:disks large-associated protein 5 n=1 Tax=Anomaloglossus baeobatrachus TaxID=238106 RepID=UPI003F4F44F0